MTEAIDSSADAELGSTCPNGHDVSPDDVVCNKCAHLVDRSDEGVLCPNGHSIRPGAVFCDQCGAAMVEKNEAVAIPGASISESRPQVDNPEPRTVDAIEQSQSPGSKDLAPTVTAPVSVARYQAPSLNLASSQPGMHVEYPTVTSQPRKTGKFRRNRVSIILVSILCLLLVGAGVLAFQQNSVANKWMHDDQQEVHKNAALSSQISSLHGRVSNLNGQVSNLQSQVSAVSNQKEKAEDQNAVLTSALQDAANVADQLDTCVTDTQVVLSDISDSLNSGFLSPSLQSDADTAGSVCSQAQTDDNALQQVLSGG